MHFVSPVTRCAPELMSIRTVYEGSCVSSQMYSAVEATHSFINIGILSIRDNVITRLALDTQTGGAYIYLDFHLVLST